MGRKERREEERERERWEGKEVEVVETPSMTAGGLRGPSEGRGGHHNSTSSTGENRKEKEGVRERKGGETSGEAAEDGGSKDATSDHQRAARALGGPGGHHSFVFSAREKRRKR